MSTEDEKKEVTLDLLAAMITAGFDDAYKRFDNVDEKIDAVDAAHRVEIKASREEMRQGVSRREPDSRRP